MSLCPAKQGKFYFFSREPGRKAGSFPATYLIFLDYRRRSLTRIESRSVTKLKYRFARGWEKNSVREPDGEAFITKRLLPDI